ncbi:unnamed protein product [Lactuca saligna]|uniref:Uncharacterized protein n=1 Tax=Lactuca saligna TaxID=75948 RepID=A0AA36EKK7_LACSI|nr:unnamed protein product [Lactuca saligna]
MQEEGAASQQLNLQLFKVGCLAILDDMNKLFEIPASNIQGRNGTVHLIARWNGMDHFVFVCNYKRHHQTFLVIVHCLEDTEKSRRYCFIEYVLLNLLRRGLLHANLVYCYVSQIPTGISLSSNMNMMLKIESSLPMVIFEVSQ